MPTSTFENCEKDGIDQVTHVFWDTNLFIYQWDVGSVFHRSVVQLRKKMVQADVQLVTSTMTLGELMAGPRRDGQEELAMRYRAAVAQSAVVVPFDDHAADLYSRIRAKSRIRQPDGIQLACAAAHGAELFVTNDGDLQGLQIPRIHFIVSIETALALLRG
ncbi:MAG TPA: PIN domain-containing protein [Acidobacteriaceae bacterium]